MYERHEIKSPININYAIMDAKDNACRLHVALESKFGNGCNVYVPFANKEIHAPDFDLKVRDGETKEYVALRTVQHVVGCILNRLAKLERDTGILNNVPALLDKKHGWMLDLSTRRDGGVMGFVNDYNELGLEIRVPVEPCPEMDETEPFKMALHLVCPIGNDDTRSLVRSNITELKRRTMVTLKTVGEKLDDCV